MKVLLLKPCWPYPISPEESTYNRIWPPLSLAYSASLLEETGVSVEILDAHAERLEGNRMARRMEGFDKIFITSSDLDRWLCPNLNLTPVVEAAAAASRFCPEVFLMGQHGTVNPEGMLRLTQVKGVIRGEPEFTVRDLCLTDHLESVPGISYRSNGSIRTNPPRPLTPLDRLPLPALHRLPLKRYLYELLGDRFMLLETARGCPFHCTFCAKDPMYGPGLRRRPLEQVLKEIDAAVIDHGIRSIYFFDLEFLVDKRYVAQLCDALVQRRTPIRWCCQTRVTDVQEEILLKMKQAGCRLIHFGVESASPRILKGIRKEASPADAQRAVRLTRRAGIDSLCFFMLGFGGEHPQEMEETIRFAGQLNPTYASFHVVSPHDAIEPSSDGARGVLALPRHDASFDPASKRRIRRAVWKFYLNPARLFRRLLFGLGDWRMALAQWRLFQGVLRGAR